jgi:hypothetical protein
MSQSARLPPSPAPARVRRPRTAAGRTGASSTGTGSTGTGSKSAGRTGAGRAATVSARLGKLAAAGSSGTLPLTGTSEGVIHLRDGQVTGAESSGTPGPGTGLAGRPLTSVQTAGNRAQPASPLCDPALAAALTLLEPTVDAVLDLIVSQASCARFRAVKGQAAEPALALPVTALLTEVARRQRLLHQMARAVTADTVVTRNARIQAPRFQVTAHQWALLIRTGTPITPRALAFELGRSVFGTTAEVHRLMALRLLSAADYPGQRSPDLDGGPMAVSFIRAVSDEKGEHPMSQHVAASRPGGTG